MEKGRTGACFRARANYTNEEKHDACKCNCRFSLVAATRIASNLPPAILMILEKDIDNNIGTRYMAIPVDVEISRDIPPYETQFAYIHSLRRNLLRRNSEIPAGAFLVRAEFNFGHKIDRGRCIDVSASEITFPCP